MKTVQTVFALALVSLASCKNTGDFSGSSSALDPVGMQTASQKLAQKNAKFKPGDKIMLRNSQVVVFAANPQNYSSKAEVVPASDATVVVSEGLFVKVKFHDGKVGYINDSDIVDPNESFGYGFDANGMMPAFLSDDSLNELPPPAAVQAPDAPPTVPAADTKAPEATTPAPAPANTGTTDAAPLPQPSTQSPEPTAAPAAATATGVDLPAPAAKQ